MTVPVLEVREATVRYPGGVTALDGVSMAVTAGEVLGVAGANAAGKSTLVRLLNGLLRPTAGTVRIDGTDTRRRPVADIARTVGVVLQDPRIQLVARTVADELAFGPRQAGLRREAVRERVAGLARRFALEDALAASPFALPPGRRRLLAIAAVLATAPRVLVLDEPTTGQDARVREGLIGHARALAGEGMAVVVVSHDLALLAAVADRLLVLSAGRALASAPTRQVLADAPLLSAAGLVAPQVTRLAAALSPAWRSRAVLTVDELVAALRDPPGAEA